MSDVDKPPAGWKKTREEEQMLRQFLHVDGPKGASQAFRDNYDRIFGKKSEPVACGCSDELCLVCAELYPERRQP